MFSMHASDSSEEFDEEESISSSTIAKICTVPTGSSLIGSAAVAAAEADHPVLVAG
jgi:hypothetical protein